MTWEMIGATGEWAAAIAVVASLLYLARQIKLANQQSKGAARYSFLSAYGLANAAIGESYSKPTHTQKLRNVTKILIRSDDI